MTLVVAGLSFRTAPLAVRESAAVPAALARTLLRYLVGHAGFSGAAVLSTCNRTEFILTGDGAAASDAVARLAPHLDPGGEHEVVRFMSAWTERDAVEHIFRVAAGLESMVLGEVQVLGQVKAAHATAREAGTLDAHLDFVLRQAISTAKVVHTETPLGRGAGSLSEVAISRARAVAGDLRGRGVLLVGAGEMAGLAARRLQEMGARILVTSRGDSKLALAGQVEGLAVAPERLEEVAPDVDVILSSAGSGAAVLTVSMVEAVQQRRRQRPLCIVDIAVPRDVEPEAAGVPGVTLLDIDDIGRHLEGHMNRRREALPAAERIIQEQLARTMRVVAERDSAAPTIRALIHHAEAVRRREVERVMARRPGATADERDLVEQLTTGLVRKLLHDPVAHLRGSAADPSVAFTLRQAFRLDDRDPVPTQQVVPAETPEAG